LLTETACKKGVFAIGGKDKLRFLGLKDCGIFNPISKKSYNPTNPMNLSLFLGLKDYRIFNPISEDLIIQPIL
jgi:hypothetical protein